MPTTIEIPIEGSEELSALAEGDQLTVESNDGNTLTVSVNGEPAEEETEEEPVEGETDAVPPEGAPTITKTKVVTTKPSLANMMRRGSLPV